MSENMKVGRWGLSIVDVESDKADEVAWVHGRITWRAERSGMTALMLDVPCGCYSDGTESDQVWSLAHEGARVLSRLLGLPRKDWDGCSLSGASFDLLGVMPDECLDLGGMVQDALCESAR